MVEMKNATVAEAYLELLSLRGIDCFFANPGTDFASIVDAFAFSLKSRLAGRSSSAALVPPNAAR